MIKNLVIVESPAKAKTIEKFLGKDYKVMSSYGHIRDLSKKGISIEKGNDITPIYEVPAEKASLVRELKAAAKDAQTIWLASDEDREGEAIAWHLSEVLGLDPKTTKRIVFHEITKDAILYAIAHPRAIDLNRVDAQQARRVLDRIVGFELSPVLWKKIKPALSAGRVQSVAVRLIVERENEIKEFKSEPYFRVNGVFATASGRDVKAELSTRLPTSAATKAFLDDCAKATFEVTDVNVKPLKKSPVAPFTTSTLQQEASRKLGFTVAQTMMVAQRLYEAGHITYMRTDSVNLSQLALNAIAKEITTNIGPEYLHERHFHTSSKGAQEAHEAIRPTYIDKATIDGSQQEQRLYTLIRRRTIASQMADAEIEKTTVDIQPSTRPEHFTVSGEVIKFDGFLRVYMESSDDVLDESQEPSLPPLAVGDRVDAAAITGTERFTQHPPRYTEATLVKKMEELGIGRPSTYAPTISTIQNREYIVKGDRPGEERQYQVMTLKDGKISVDTRTETVGSDKGKLIPTDIGTVVNQFLTEYFPNVLDYNFTADIEERFDAIADGTTPWHSEITHFYDVFHPEVVKADETRLDHKVGERILGIDPESGKTVSVTIGRFGPVVQIGDAEDEEKPRFASLRKEQSVYDISLEEALKLFDLPRTLGQYQDKTVTAAIGRFGPYIRHDGKFVSIPKDMSPLTITLEEAIQLIEAKREADKKKLVRTFEEDPDMQILNGRFGVYISYKKSNYKIPKNVADPAALTFEDCQKLIQEQDAAPKKPSRRFSKKK